MLGTAYETVCILTVGFYILLNQIRIAPARWLGYVSSPLAQVSQRSSYGLAVVAEVGPESGCARLEHLPGN